MQHNSQTGFEACGSCQVCGKLFDLDSLEYDVHREDHALNGETSGLDENGNFAYFQNKGKDPEYEKTI